MQAFHRNRGEVALEELAGIAQQEVLLAGNHHVEGAEGRPRTDAPFGIGQFPRGMGQQKTLRGVGGKVDGVAVDHAAADVDLLQVGRLQVFRLDRRRTPGTEAQRHVVGAGHGVEHGERRDVGEVGIGAIAAFPQHAEIEHRGFHRMRRHHRADFQSHDVVPLPFFEVADVEILGEFAFRYRQQGAELPRYRGTHQRRGEILQRLVALQQRGQAGEVVIVAVGVEDAGHLLLAYAEGIEAVVDVRTRVDQVDPPLMDQDAAHRRTVVVPAVAVAGMHHGEVMAVDVDVAQRVGAGIGFVQAQVEVDFDAVFAVADLEHVVRHALDADAGADVQRAGGQWQAFDEGIGLRNLAEGKLELDPHQLFGDPFIDAGLDHFFGRDQAVVAAVDVAQLRGQLFRGADQFRLPAGVVRMVGDQHALAIEHLQDRELGQVAQVPVLHHGVRQEDRVRSVFEGDAILFGGLDDATAQQVLDAVGGRSAKQVKPGGRNLDVGNSVGDDEFAYRHHWYPGKQLERQF